MNMIWQETLVRSWNQVLSSFMSAIPLIVAAILTFSIGLVLASWVKKGVLQLFKFTKLDQFFKSLGADNYLKKADFKFNLSELLAEAAKWLVILTFFLAAVDVLGLSEVADVLRDVLGYVPNVFAASIILAGGYYVAILVEGLVRGAIVSMDKKLASPLSRFARWLIIIVAFFAAVDQLQIAQTFVSVFFQGLTYTLVLVIGLSVGLGSKDLVAKILEDWYRKNKS